MFILRDWTVIRLEEINPYKAVDLMGNWRLTFNNGDTIIKAKMQLQQLYRKRWKNSLISLLDKNENKEKRVKVAQKAIQKWKGKNHI